MEKLEWCGHLMVKKFWWYVYSFWHDPGTWHTQTPHDDIGYTCITLQKSIVVRSCNLCSDLRDCCLIGCTDLMNIQQAKAASKASSLLSDDIWWNVTYWPAWQSPGTSVCHACNLFIEKFLLLLLVRCVVYTRIVFSSSRGVGVAEVGRLKMMVSVSISPLLMF